MKKHLGYLLSGLAGIGVIGVLFVVCVALVAIHPAVLVVALTLLLAWIVGQNL